MSQTTDSDEAQNENIALHTDVGLATKKFECGYCGEIVEKPRFKEIEDVVAQHVTYHCGEVGLCE